jgi:hypothetical protein
VSNPDAASITRELLATFTGVHAATTWGDTFFCYDPDGRERTDLYFATLKTQDDEYDRASNLDRGGLFRLNVGVRGATFRALFAAGAPGPTTVDALFPHPVYGAAHWVSVISPTAATFESLRPLLAEAYALVISKHAKRA